MTRAERADLGLALLALAVWLVAPLQELLVGSELMLCPAPRVALDAARLVAAEVRPPRPLGGSVQQMLAVGQALAAAAVAFGVVGGLVLRLRPAARLVGAAGAGVHLMSKSAPFEVERDPLDLIRLGTLAAGLALVVAARARAPRVLLRLGILCLAELVLLLAFAPRAETNPLGWGARGLAVLFATPLLVPMLHGGRRLGEPLAGPTPDRAPRTMPP